ncbi:hypothetical protein ER308_08740 [Egibacter rhizosphaerae]|uniref:Uncharacterized protein n=1 Tax=Egibacter rhizosphaerae TaxID=1670831 RepID=A0A411YEI9_9ACTN|nr:hypothetical protein [Egibacter rhizosphaerae]QBI19629.1 hypothetical protein ER308_08740 [Egibacter rhizosphaerae]
MQRSRSQTLYRYLPGAVYLHDDELVVRTSVVRGNPLGPTINKNALLAEVEHELRRWDEDKRAGIRVPRDTSDEAFVVIEPVLVQWEVWPLVFQCANRHCQRVRRFYRDEQVLEAREGDQRVRCEHCRSRLRQLRYYSAHACGRIQPMFVPTCRGCGSDENVFLEDTGSFETAAWRCRTCGNAYIKGTRMSPCDCGQYLSPQQTSSQAFMRQYTVRDPRSFYPQTVSLLNLKTNAYEQLQRHHARGRIAAASYLGDEARVGIALNELAGGESGERMSQEEWEEAIRTKYSQLDDDEIEAIRRRRGPATEGVAATSDLSAAACGLAAERRMLERATLYDPQQVARYRLEDAHDEAQRTGRTAQERALLRARERAGELGVDELAVTDQFPIAVAAYGYTRTSKRPNTSTLRGFARRGEYDNKDPIFAVTTDTEAALVALSAVDVLAWLRRRGSYPAPVPSDERDARAAVLEMFAVEETAPEGPQDTRVLVHTLSHVLLRALDDGRTGFGEASLAEWLVPETLTISIYVSSFQSHTLGALWTLLHSRSLEWMERAFDASWRCDNDPLCHHRRPRACERCLYLTFGCRRFNSDLSRELAMDFWRT